MFISKKKLMTFSSIVSSIIVIALFGTPCYQYTGLITRGDYYLGFDFGFGGIQCHTLRYYRCHFAF